MLTYLSVFIVKPYMGADNFILNCFAYYGKK